MGKDIGIDLGTASVLVYVKGKGILFREPSVVAMDKNTNKILKVGREAQLMLGRTPTNIMAIRPLREGVINQYDVTRKMIQHFIRRACSTLVFKPRVMVCVPSGITEVEERAVVDAATQAGAKKTYLIEEPLAAAIGAGIDIMRPNGNMVIDIGGGTTDVAVISLGAVVTSKSIKVAGDKFDEAIIKFIKRKYNLVIGERTAEDIKMRIGCVWPREEMKIMSVKGRCTIEGLPKVQQINSTEIEEAMQEPVQSITEIVRVVLENTPPELVGDISTNGIVMTGGGSLVYGFDTLMANITGINAWVAEDPISCVAIGTGKSLEDKHLKYLPEGVINISRNRQQ
ncbi:MAG: rod shape-determining protein MreB [Oscillospiraceae bacterium]|nr:rod shape-determining protein MreB [Oscillospiraceae bacterium]